MAREKWWLGIGLVALGASVLGFYFSLRSERALRAAELRLRANDQAISRLTARVAELEARGVAQQARVERVAPQAAQVAAPAAADVGELAAAVAERARTEQELARSDRSSEQIGAFDVAARSLDNIIRAGHWSEREGVELSKLSVALHPDDLDELRRQFAAAVNAGKLRLDGDAPF